MEKEPWCILLFRYPTDRPSPSAISSSDLPDLSISHLIMLDRGQSSHFDFSVVHDSRPSILVNGMSSIRLSHSSICYAFLPMWMSLWATSCRPWRHGRNYQPRTCPRILPNIHQQDCGTLHQTLDHRGPKCSRQNPCYLNSDIIQIWIKKRYLPDNGRHRFFFAFMCISTCCAKFHNGTNIRWSVNEHFHWGYFWTGLSVS